MGDKKPSRKCGHVSREGRPCGAWARRGSDPPRCSLHALTAEERKARSARAASASARKRSKVTEPAGLAPGITLEQVLEVVAPALEARFEHDGSPDWSARLAAAGVLISSFPRELRDTPERVRKLLEAILPEHVHNLEHMDAQRVYSALRREWDQLGLAYNELTGLYVKPYPPHLIAPFEDAEQVQRERPAPIPAADAPIVRLPDGRLAVKRRGALPLVVERR